MIKNSICLSERQIRRILKYKGLMRRGTSINELAVLSVIQEEINGSGCCLGYRSMTKRLLTKYGLHVPRDKVYSMMKQIDPEGIQLRKSHRLSRRMYSNRGPNYLIHIDGHDKIKRYGFAIHGAICGFSRRILWLRVDRTNNDPNVVASYFLEYLLEIGGVPRCVRADRGSENIVIENIQKALRWFHLDDMAGENSFIYGRSPSNQRIERWWLNAKQGGIQFWIDLFKDLEDIGEITTENGMKKEFLRFAFTNLIQQDLNCIREDWNQHTIRSSNNTETSPGKPDMLFYAPELYRTIDYKTGIERDELEAFSEFCHFPHRNGCSQQFSNQCCQLIEESGQTLPKDYIEALHIYKWLCSYVNESDEN